MQLFAGRFDLPYKLTDIFADQDNSEYDLIVKYTPRWNKKLQFKIEVAYIDFDTDYNFRAYEDLHAYDDIWDLLSIILFKRFLYMIYVAYNVS